MDKPKSYLLERDNNFWEIIVKANFGDKNETTTTIRAGKKGNKGRQFPAKKHQNFQKARQFALQQVNSKIIQGFSPISSVPASIKSQMRRGASSLRRITPKTNSVPVSRANSVAKDWRRPPKKQTTIRRMCRQPTLSGPDVNATPLSRKQSVRRQNTASSLKSSNVLSKSKLSRQATVQITDTESTSHAALTRSTSRSRDIPTDKVVAKWRKPHKKQSTIRRLAKSQTLRKSASLRKTLF